MHLADTIRTIPDYPKKGILFRDITTLLGDARAFRRTVDELVQPWAGTKIDKVAGVEARGFILGGATLRSIGDIARRQRILDNDADYVDPKDMLAELRDDNERLTSIMRQVHNVCDTYGDVATASLLENWIDETERRTWFLFEATRGSPGAND